VVTLGSVLSEGSGERDQSTVAATTALVSGSSAHERPTFDMRSTTTTGPIVHGSAESPGENNGPHVDPMERVSIREVTSEVTNLLTK